VDERLQPVLSFRGEHRFPIGEPRRETGGWLPLASILRFLERFFARAAPPGSKTQAVSRIGIENWLSGLGNP
jgi:hypothetical protein